MNAVKEAPAAVGDAQTVDVLSAESPLAAAQAGNAGFRIASAALDKLFKFPPFFETAKNSARTKIVKRAALLGVDWDARVDELQRIQYDALYSADVAAATPAYYKSPFHAYAEGNLCWQAALEVEPSAISVHANIYTENGEFERDGDDKLRSTFLSRTLEILRDSGAPAPKDIVDLGCSTGLSTLALSRTFPDARHITGVDLSPHMLSIARLQLATRPDLTSSVNFKPINFILNFNFTPRLAGVDLSPHMLSVARHQLATRPDLTARAAPRRIDYVYAAAEATGLPDASADLVCLCLVAHELPQGATRAILAEARRVLRRGGALAFMDMDPLSPAFQRMATNPMAFAGFKSTEPFLLDYVSLDFKAALAETGFERVAIRSNSPRHRTVVAFTA
ncbi:S-adenosyl-L-methionine-dependent methyltransferase [Tribonema minus]|uniref:S-adenosyl-L-methionine-dependent methyltransferase n=1 Tax=Tribonema minus TaxID=303371 RepID=A0A836C987_9STRA|nr:S-adenosyl-L-methionine-dependent methyltransferase [Tribonema minus]